MAYDRTLYGYRPRSQFQSSVPPFPQPQYSPYVNPYQYYHMWPYQPGWFPVSKGPVVTTSAASKVAGGLIAASGALTLVLLVFDKFIWITAPENAFFLMVFTAIDIILGIFLLLEPLRWVFILTVIWAATRTAVWLGVIIEAPIYGITFAQFADYLFNPLKTTPPNPPGVPGIFVDPIILLEIIVLVFALIGAFTRSWFPSYSTYRPY